MLARLIFVLALSCSLVSSIAAAQPALTIGTPQQIYQDGPGGPFPQVPITMDGSMATLRRDASTIWYWTTDWSVDNAYTRWVGTLSDPFQSTVAGWPKGIGMWNLQGLPEPKRPWLYNIYQVSPNVLLGFLHLENTGGGPPYAVGLGYSTDNGETWLFLGKIAQPQDTTQNVGGVPYLVVGSYFYIYFHERATGYSGFPDPVVARALISDVIAAAQGGTVSPWKKYNGGTWTQDALTGVGSSVFTKLHPTHPLDMHQDAAFNSALGRYMITADDPAVGELYLYLSNDGVAWDPAIIVDAAINRVLEYATFTSLAPSDAIDHHIVGSDFYLIYPHKDLFNYSFDDLYRVHVTVTGADTIPPTDPTNLAVTAVTSDEIDLTWTASTDNNQVVNYRVERAVFSGTCGAFTEVAQPTTTTYRDTGLTPSTTYCYRLRAWDGINFSVNYTNIATAQTLALRTLSLAWNDNSPNAQNTTPETNFQIERCSGPACSTFVSIALVGQNVTAYTDMASPSPVAGYRVTAVPTGGGYSNIIYSTPAMPPSVLSVAPPSLTFTSTVGSNPPTQALTISNGGGTGMVWTVASNASWLSAVPSSGTDNGALTVSVNVAGLTSGTQFAAVTVTAPGATGSPFVVPVTLSLSPVTAPNSGSSGRIR